MIISNIIANQIIGNKQIGNHKRVWVPLLVGGEAWLWMFNWQIALLTMIAFPIWRYDGWGEQFLTMHGDRTHYNNRRKKIITKIADFLFPNPSAIQDRKVYGMLWGGLRGLYDLSGFAALSILLQNYYIALIGLLMGLQGVMYYIDGKLPSKFHHAPAGAWRGLLWTIALVMGGAS